MSHYLLLICAIICVLFATTTNGASCGSFAASPASLTLNEGSIFSLTFVQTSNIGSLVNVTISWGDGTVDKYFYFPTNRPNLIMQHVYATNSVGYTVNVKTTSNETNIGNRCTDNFNLNVQVNNVAPVIISDPTPPFTDIYDGSSFTILLVTFSDAGTLDTHTASVNWGDGSAIESCFVNEMPFGPPGSSAGLTGTVSCNPHTYATGTFEAILTIDDNSSASVSSNYFISQQSRLFVTPGPAQIANTNNIVSISATFVDTLPIEHSVLINWGDGFSTYGLVQETIGSSSTTGSISANHIYTTFDVYTVFVTVIAGGVNPASTSVPLNVTIFSQTPIVTLKKYNPRTILPGVMIPLPNCTFIGSPLDSYKASINWGDGTVDVGQIFSFSFGGGVVVGQHSYSSSGAYSVDVIVTNTISGQSGSDSDNVIVRNTAPLISVIPDQIALAQVLFNVNFTFNDLSSSDVHKLVVDWGDSTPIEMSDLGFGSGGSVITISHIYASIGNYIASVSVFDNRNINGTRQFNVQVTQAPFSIYVDNFSPSVNQGSQFALPVFADVRNNNDFQFTINWGDGSSPTIATPSFVQIKHVYYVVGTYTIGVTLTNIGDQTSVFTSLVVNVNNVAPTVDAVFGTNGQSAHIRQGSIFSLNALYFDAGIYDTHVAGIAWDETTITPIGALAPTNATGYGSLQATNQFNNVGIFDVLVLIFDNHGARGSGTIRVVVDNTPIAITLNPPVQISSSLRYTGTLATCTDFGSNQTFNITIAWGDGSSSVYNSNVCTVSGSHSYQKKGVYFVLITVVDSSGDSVTAKTTITLV